MRWMTRLFFLAMATVVLYPSSLLHSFPPAEAIRSPRFHFHFHFRSAPPFHKCPHHRFGPTAPSSPCHPSLIHVAITLDVSYLRGSIAAVHSLLRHSSCPDRLFLHFLTSPPDVPHLSLLVRSTFPSLRFRLYPFHPSRVRCLISPSVRPALDQPLNYARNYLADLLHPCVRRVLYLDSDLVLVDDVSSLWSHPLGPHPLGAPEYCHANFTSYFTSRFWSDPALSGTFRRSRSRRPPCYFNTGVMVLDLERWRRSGYTAMLERWMEVQKEGKIYELGSLPPFLLVFAGRVAAIDHRWNQHGLGGDNVKGSCRELHPGPVSLLHWSGSGKPWARLDAGRPCPLDALWKPYDLYVPPAPAMEMETEAETAVHPR